MTIVEQARKRVKNRLISKIAKEEKVSYVALARSIAMGHAVIPRNKLRNFDRPCGIGKGLKTKINVNLGTSPDSSDITNEIKKLELSIKYEADTVMDLSVGDQVKKTRRKILEKCSIPLGTVPMYEIAVNAGNDIARINPKQMMDVLIEQAKDGVDFFTIHAGVTQETAKVVKKSKRIIDIVSRGGAIMYKWMDVHKKENPFYEYFDEVIDIAREYDITLSLGDGMRPGAVSDASDKAQIRELEVLGALRDRAFKKGVQVIIEGPGHVPINKIKENIDMQKKICKNAPFYVLGPLVTDIAPGYDHITSAIGGALAASYGADFLCYVTPAEHLCLPSLDDVKEGVIASKIAAHAADLAKGRKDSWKKDAAISRARRHRDWETQFSIAIDREKPVRYRRISNPAEKDVCTMCSNYCPIKLTENG